MIGGSNGPRGAHGSLQGHTWSLAVEEHFYVLLPLLVLLSGTLLPFAALSIIAVTNINRLLLVFVWGPDFPGWGSSEDFKYVHYHSTYMRMDALLFGCLLVWFSMKHARHYQRIFEHAWTGALGAAIIVGSVSLCRLSPKYYQPTAGYLVNSIGACFVVASMNTIKQVHNRVLYTLLYPLAFTGFYSYAIYLFHMFFRTAFSYFSLYKGYLSDPLAFALYCASSIGAGWMVTNVVERPVSKFRAYLVGSPVLP